MTDSKKNSNDESIFDRIASSINKIEKIDSEEESNEENINKKNINKENINKEKYDDNTPSTSDEELFLTSKTDEIFSNDLKRKFPFLAIIGIVIGIIIILAGTFFILGSSERVVDSVASGETGTLAIFIMFIGILILGTSILIILSKSSILSYTFDNLNDLKLLDEEDYNYKYENNSKNNPISSNSSKSNSKDSFTNFKDNSIDSKDSSIDNSKVNVKNQDKNTEDELNDLKNNSNKCSVLKDFDNSDSNDNLKKFKDLDEDGNEISNDENNKEYEILDIDNETSETNSKSNHSKLNEDSNKNVEKDEELQW